MSTRKIAKNQLEKRLTELLTLRLVEWDSVQDRMSEIKLLRVKLASLRKEKTIKKFQKIIKALNNPSRLEILFLINHGTTCLCELEYITELAQATISHHITKLEDVGLIKRNRKGKWTLLEPSNRDFVSLINLENLFTIS